MSADKMPPLPEQTCLARDTYTGEKAFGYEASDMHAYARAYAAEQTRELVEAVRSYLAAANYRAAALAAGDEDRMRHADEMFWRAHDAAAALIAKHKETK